MACKKLRSASSSGECSVEDLINLGLVLRLGRHDYFGVWQVSGYWEGVAGLWMGCFRFCHSLGSLNSLVPGLQRLPQWYISILSLYLEVGFDAAERSETGPLLVT